MVTIVKTDKTEKLLGEVLREVRHVRQMLEVEEDSYDRLEYYEHPERIVASFEAAKKLYGKPRK